MANPKGFYNDEWYHNGTPGTEGEWSIAGDVKCSVTESHWDLEIAIDVRAFEERSLDGQTWVIQLLRRGTLKEEVEEKVRKVFGNPPRRAGTPAQNKRWNIFETPIPWTVVDSATSDPQSPESAQIQSLHFQHLVPVQQKTRAGRAVSRYRLAMYSTVRKPIRHPLQMAREAQNLCC